jgi:polyhydroxybutyrate depolymerase
MSEGIFCQPVKSRMLPRWLATLCALLALPCCKATNPDPQTGSETNFLQRCEGNCGEGLACLCGVCTKACTGSSECSEFASNAKCVSVLQSPDAGTDESCHQGATCDLSCTRAADCSALGSGYLCEMGYCRKGPLTCPGSSLVAGNFDREVIVDSTTRAYTLHVPPGYSGDTPIPLVLDFHAMGAGALAWEQANSGFQALSDQQGFLVVWPQGLENSWNVGPCCTSSSAIDDFAFARAIVRQLSIEGCIDPGRVYAVGFSMGGAMAYYLACKESEIFASIAVSSMDLFADSEIACAPSRPVTEISFRGTSDTVVPYAGGTSSPPGHPEFTNDLLGAVGTFQKWAGLDQCTGSPSADDANGCSSYTACRDGTQVTLCSTQGGGQVVGDAALAWDVLKAHPMP